jgi:nicotinate-nucleotide adenylyltransferase
MTAKYKRIGLWGGSFNPPTLAHKALANYAFSALKLEELHWIVTPQNPEKDALTLAPFKHRLQMVDRILQDHNGMLANDIEHRQGSSWTVNTVKALRKEMPDDYLFFMMGTDNWLGFHLWGDDFSEIFDYVSIVVFNRPGLTPNEQAEASKIFSERRVTSPDNLQKSGSFYILDNPLYDMSATQVRQALVNGELPEQITADTLQYINDNNLYK